jgi:signal transduction histidine kinase
MRKRILRFLDPLKSYPFQLKHLSVLFFVIIMFQVIVSVLHKASLEKFLLNTQTWYQQDSAERLANLTATSLELLLETKGREPVIDERDVTRLVQGLNIILSQQILNQNVKEVCILIPEGGRMRAIDEGQALYAHMSANSSQVPHADSLHRVAIRMYEQIRGELTKKEEIHTIVEDKQTFHVFVPFVLRGEFVGVLYMQNSPDFGFISRGITSSYDETAVTFFALILFGLLAMFYISSYTVKARNEAQQSLFRQEKERLGEHINHQKELMFTRRIYHTHHKAEKVMGFIKEDLRSMTNENIEETKNRVTKYANFVARVIYDMKWYDPPVQTIRSPLFKTDVNQVLRFLIDHVFGRVTASPRQAEFVLDFDNNVPSVPVNEFVMWEVFEPIIQNCIEHSSVPTVVIGIRTRYDDALRTSIVSISDNGLGVPAELLEMNEQGIKRIFLESVSSKTISNQHSGYGCYIAHEIATQRCGWKCHVDNLPTGGCIFTFIIPHQA